MVAEDRQKLITAISALVIGIDRKGFVDKWNRRAEILTGFTEEEAVGKPMVQHFITGEFKDSMQLMLSQVLQGQEIANYEFSLFTKGGQRREILLSAAPRRDHQNQVAGVVGVGQDITELRSESKMLANYVRICGAAVWSLRGDAMTGAVTDSKTKEIEHLISQQAQMDVSDPRMVLWRASFVSILKTMCQNFWMRRKEAQVSGEKAEKGGGSLNGVVTTDFGYEFCFEAPNGSVKWYKVQGHLIQEMLTDSQFEVFGSMQEVTSMLIDKVMGDRWQKWWNRMCHMVFDATLLVDTQEYRVLNAWGEEKVFGCKLQSHHPLLQLIKPEDTVSLKEAFNEVTFKGFERGRTLHLQSPTGNKDMAAKCFLLSADQENPNECMMGIRLQVSGTTDEDAASALWDVAKPQPVLTLEDLARLKSGLKRSHRRPSHIVKSMQKLPHRSRSSDPHTSSHSLSSIPEDQHGENDLEEEEDDMNSVSDRGADSNVEDTESVQSSSKSSKSSGSSKSSNGSISEVGVCNSSPAGSASEELGRRSPDTPGTFAPQSRGRSPHHSNGQPSGAASGDVTSPFGLSPELKAKQPEKRQQKQFLKVPKAKAHPTGPPCVKLKWKGKVFAMNLDEFDSFMALREHINVLTGVPSFRQTLILAGRRVPLSDEATGSGDSSRWQNFKVGIHPNQTLMLVGTAAGEAEEGAAAAEDQGVSLSPECEADVSPPLTPAATTDR